MPSFIVHLTGQREPIAVDLAADGIDGLVEQASQSRFLIGHLTEGDEEGVCRRVMIATCRIQCVVEAD